MKSWGAILVFFLGLSATNLFAQATQPTANLPLEYRANTAFNQGRYAAALPLLQELAGTLIDQPEKLGPVEERVRVCKKAIVAAQKMQADASMASTASGLTGTASFSATPAAPAAEATSAEKRIQHPAPDAGKIVDLPIKQLGNFDYDAEHGGNIPTDVQRMDGCTIRTYGYMIPLDQAENISEFALVPSLFACCFGQPPAVQHTIVVHLKKGKAINYFPDMLAVEGTLHVQEKKDEGYIVSIFEIDATSIKPAPQ